MKLEAAPSIKNGCCTVGVGVGTAAEHDGGPEAEDDGVGVGTTAKRNGA